MESEQLKVTDLRIGDRVRDKSTGHEFVVTGIHWNLQNDPTEAALYLDYSGSEYVYMRLNAVELVEKGGAEQCE